LSDNLLNKQTANDVIQEAISLGADFCDIFVEKATNQNITFKSSTVKDIQSGIDFGIGVRLIFGEQALYAYTNSVDKDDLIKMTRNLAAYYKRGATQKIPTLDFTKEVKYKEILAIPDKDVSLEHKISVLQKLDKLTRSESDLVNQVNLNLGQKITKVEIFDSEGMYAKETRPWIRLATSAITQDGSDQESGSFHPGCRGGWEFVEGIDLEAHAKKIVEQSLTVLKADLCPAGKMPVVIDNGFGGVIFHEACGHLLETTSVEKKASVMWDKKEELIAHSAVSAVDDGTMDNEWGSISIDDEGMPTERTQLIKDGRLENFLCDRMGNIKTGHRRTGSARRQNYKFAPASRMRNTFIEPGPHSLDDLLQSMGDGLYAKSMGGGSVNPGTGEFNFSVNEGFMVKNGKIQNAVKGATLIGKGEDVLKTISMVGSNFELATGMCGSVSGSIPTTVGQAAIKVDDILVGGQV
jgi:TldD protein